MTGLCTAGDRKRLRRSALFAHSDSGTVIYALISKNTRGAIVQCVLSQEAHFDMTERRRCTHIAGACGHRPTRLLRRPAARYDVDFSFE
jgi:hypothetical protein